MGETFSKNRPLFFFLIGLVVTFIIALVLWKPLLPFFVGFLIAYLLHPLVEWFHKKLPFRHKRGAEMQRIFIIIITFIIILAIICGIIYLIIFSVSGPFGQFIANAPTLITDGLQHIADWIRFEIKDLRPEHQEQINKYIDSIGESLGTWLQEAFSKLVPAIFSTVTFIIGFFVLPFFLVLFMANIHKLGQQFYSIFSPEITYHIQNFLKILDRVFGRYIRATILAGLIMGAVITIIFVILNIPLAPAQGLIFGLFQMIPTIGGAVAMVIGLIITLALDPSKILAVLIVYLVMNLIVSTVLMAKLQGSAVYMDASIIMILIIVGAYLGGIVGMILIVPTVAVVYSLYKYIRDEIKHNRVLETEKN